MSSSGAERGYQQDVSVAQHDPSRAAAPNNDVVDVFKVLAAQFGNEVALQPFSFESLLTGRNRDRSSDLAPEDLPVAQGSVAAAPQAPQEAQVVAGGAGIRAQAAAAAAALTRRSASSSNSSSGDAPAISSQTLLHRACQQFATNSFVIKTALDFESSAIRKKMTIAASSKKANQVALRNRFVAFPQRRSKGQTKAGKQPWFSKEPFSLPVNIALHNGASLDALVLLVCAAPDVLTHQDSPNRLCSLSLTLLTRPNDTQAIELVLTANPRAVVIPDRRQNLPLHIACQKGSPLEVVRQLHCLYPEAATTRNFHGETPLIIAQRNSKCPEEVLNFLQRL